eukprot:CAMPEP_0182434978 /NCGR_PEP_ID=MMETSP1167-20130531/72896_1 /TAXON_ID=2988 /ORGANISM="Mallomonas Sp, Strain CCMP3275" /LENGTH=171 /DNA_ID=CAMNT_0024625461 /DNA_START=70 /DNA_END=581 /DNA_ORIENTATION=-
MSRHRNLKYEYDDYDDYDDYYDEEGYSPSYSSRQQPQTNTNKSTSKAGTKKTPTKTVPKTPEKSPSVIKVPSKAVQGKSSSLTPNSSGNNISQLKAIPQKTISLSSKPNVSSLTSSAPYIAPSNLIDQKLPPPPSSVDLRENTGSNISLQPPVPSVYKSSIAETSSITPLG